MELVFFLTQVFVISLSGALSPGPMTAAAIAMGPRRRLAGLGLAAGHIGAEFPVMMLIAAGAATILNTPGVRLAVALAGGAMLVWMGAAMLKGARDGQDLSQKYHAAGPVATGMILSVGNPYFLVWWATVGLTLVTGAKELGVGAFALFMLVHWLCDAGWLTALSWASFKGATLLGVRRQAIIMAICACAVAAFGLMFIAGALKTLFT